MMFFGVWVNKFFSVCSSRMCLGVRCLKCLLKVVLSIMVMFLYSSNICEVSRFLFS